MQKQIDWLERGARSCPGAVPNAYENQRGGVEITGEAFFVNLTVRGTRLLFRWRLRLAPPRADTPRLPHPSIVFDFSRSRRNPSGLRKGVKPPRTHARANPRSAAFAYASHASGRAGPRVGRASGAAAAALLCTTNARHKV